MYQVWLPFYIQNNHISTKWNKDSTRLRLSKKVKNHKELKRRTV